MFMVSAHLLEQYPGIQIYNRGVSGDRVSQLRDRWQEDCVDLKPTVLSLMIGVNDTWHGLSPNNTEIPTPYDTFEETYRWLLDQSREAVPGVQFLLAEPFVLPCGVGVDLPMRSNLDPRREIVHKLAIEYDAGLIRYQDVFDEALERADASYWAADGVHPTIAGHRLMANAWLEAAVEL